MFREAENRVVIEGILAEVDLKYGSYVSKVDGSTVENIGGSIKVLVNQNGQDNEVPVYMYSNKLTKVGKVNPAYEAIEKVRNEFVSIAASGDKNVADKIRITSGKIKMNEFVGQNGSFVSYPRVQANFASKVVGEFNPKATFTLEFVVSKIKRVVDADGVEVEPTRLEIEAIVPQYTAENASAMNVDVVKLFADNPNGIAAIEADWTAGDTYKVNGRLNFTSRTETIVDEVAWGEAQERTRTISTNELIITGSSDKLDGEIAYDIDDIKAGMALRTQKIEDMKSGKKSVAKQAPAPATGKGTKDLGF